MKPRTYILFGVLAAVAVAAGVAIYLTVTRPFDTLGAGSVDEIETIAFSPDGKSLVSGSNDGTIKIWDLETRETRATFPAHEGLIHTIVFSPSGKTFATGGNADRKPHTVKLWDFSTGKVLKSLTIESGPVWSLAFSPDGKTLAAGGRLAGAKGGVAIWDLESDAAEELDIADINHLVAFSPDGKTLAIRSGQFIELWDVGTKKQASKIPAAQAAWNNDLLFSPDGQTLLAVNKNTQQAELWNIGTGQAATPSGPISANRAIALSPDGKTLAANSGDQVELWDMTTLLHKRTLKLHSLLQKVGTVTDLAYSPDGKTLAVACGIIKLVPVPQ